MTGVLEPSFTRFVQDPGTYAWTFGGYEPVRTVVPGEILEVFTEDAFGGRIVSATDVPSRNIEFPFVNPQTGPFYVEGAEPGDTLALHLIDVRPARDWGVSAHLPFAGALSGTRYTATLQKPLPERAYLYRVDASQGSLWFEAADSSCEIELPLEPFMGTIGVAPAGHEVRSTLVPEAFGGNMDTPEAKAGTTVFLGVNVPGALFSLGDGHYRQGEGEACGSAVEGAMVVTLTVDVIKGTSCEWPRLEDDESVMVAGSGRPLEDAFRIAHTQLVRWVAEASGLSTPDAYQLISQTATSRIANVVDPNYTIVAKVPKRYLPAGSTWMQETHEKLRRAGGAFSRVDRAPEQGDPPSRAQ